MTSSWFSFDQWFSCDLLGSWRFVVHCRGTVTIFFQQCCKTASSIQKQIRNQHFCLSNSTQGRHVTSA